MHRWKVGSKAPGGKKRGCCSTTQKAGMQWWRLKAYMAGLGEKENPVDGAEGWRVDSLVFFQPQHLHIGPSILTKLSIKISFVYNRSSKNCLKPTSQPASHTNNFHNSLVALLMHLFHLGYSLPYPRGFGR